MTRVVRSLAVARPHTSFSSWSVPAARRPADEDDPWADPDWEEWQQAETEPDDADEWDEPLPDGNDPPGLHDDDNWDDDELD